MTQSNENQTPADLAVSADWIVPVVPAGRVLRDCSLLIEKDKIIGLCPQDEVQRRFQVKESLHLKQSVLMPGLINAHGHSPMTLLRGYADDMPLNTWLSKHIWPAEKKWVSPEFVYDGSRLAIAEMLLSGTSCFSDMYFFPEMTGKAANEAGMRAQLNFPVFEFQNAWAQNAEECIHKGLSLRDELRGSDLLSVAFGPHAPYTVSDLSFKKIATYMAELQMPVHIHLHETDEEISTSIKEYGLRPTERLAQLDILGPLTQCVHFTHANSSDIALLQTWQASVIHCPQSNLKLASGFCPTNSLLNAGVNLAFGTDSAASNNSLNLFGELKVAALLAKAVAGKAEAMSAHQALECVTINAAKALGLNEKIGSLEPGKQADFIAINLDRPAYYPIYDLISHLVYADARHEISHLWVAGKKLVDQGELVTLDLNEIKSKALDWQQKLRTWNTL